MYVCVYVCMYACIYMYVCMCACTYVCIYACMYVCVYVHVCMYVCMHVSQPYFIHIIVYMHACMHAYMHYDLKKQKKSAERGLCPTKNRERFCPEGLMSEGAYVREGLCPEGLMSYTPTDRALVSGSLHMHPKIQRCSVQRLYACAMYVYVCMFSIHV